MSVLPEEDPAVLVAYEELAETHDQVPQYEIDSPGAESEQDSCA